MHSKEDLLVALIKIKDQINQQIPLPANYFVEYERAPRDAGVEEIDREYAEHEIRYHLGRIEYYIYDHINEALAEYFHQTALTDPKDFSVEQKLEAQRLILSKAAQISKTLERNKKILSGKGIHNSFVSDTMPDYGYVKRYLEENGEELIASWQKTQHLVIQNPDFEKRFQLEYLLVDYRQKCLQQFIFNKMHIANDGQFQTDMIQQLVKAEYFWGGLYFDRIKSHTGYCGEHTEIALIKIFEDWKIYSQNTIEVILIDYFDHDGKPNDNHAFLAINRSPDSALNLPATWGKNAIFFDAWNKLVCFAEDLDKQPLQYFAYPDGAKWSSIKFDKSDHDLLKSLISMNDYYAIAGNEETNKRALSLIEEFQLTSLETKEMAGVANLLEEITTEVWPSQLKMKVLFFITTQGNQLVTTLPGFEDPAVIIHRDFLTSQSMEELRFALARELLYIQHYGAGLTEGLTADEEYRLDKLALEKTREGNIAIQYLQRAFVTEKDYPKAMKVPVLANNSPLNVTKAKQEQRIKALAAHIAQQPDLAGSIGLKNALPQSQSPTYRGLSAVSNRALDVADKPRHVETGINCQHALERLTTKTFYTKQFNCELTKVDKLSYLQNQLPDLYVELLPYEYAQEPSIRTREFCNLLRELKLDLTNQDELIAVNEFIHRAFNLQIPSFVELYYAVCGLKPVQLKGNQQLPPLGIFYDLQQTIDAFVNAKDYSLAKSAALNFLKLWEQLRHHFVEAPISHLVNTHYRDYKKNHDGAIPTGLDRYFGSWIGKSIKWRGFANSYDLGLYVNSMIGIMISSISLGRYLPWIGTAISSLFNLVQWSGGLTMPWDRHVPWAAQDLDGDIKRTLWFLGVHHDSGLWDTFQPKELLDIINDEIHGYSDRTIPLPIELGGRQDPDFEYQGRHLHGVLTHFSRKHQCQQTMWEKDSFEQAFVQFYDLNWIMLVAPHDLLKRNVDNEAIHSLLRQFANTAKEGTEIDKVLIKSFFLGREDKRDLEHLDTFFSRWPIPSMTHNLIYTSFVLEQEYDGLQFKLFTLKEQIEFMHNFPHIFDDLEPMRIVKLFDLPFHQLNHECLRAIIPLIKQNDMTLDWRLIGLILIAYAKQNGMPYLFSQKGVDIIGFSELAKDFEDRKKILEQFVWPSPMSAEDWNELSHESLIKIYHAFDTNLLFPTLFVQETFGQLLLKKVERINSLDERIAAVQSWLFNKDYCLVGWGDDKYYSSMSDFKLRNQLIELLVNDLLTKYGKDNGGKDYIVTLKKLMDEIIEQAPSRDLKHTFARLMDLIEAQVELSDYAGACIDPEKYVITNKRSKDIKSTSQLAILSKVAQKIGEDEEGQKQLIAFFASPLTDDSLTAIAEHIEKNNKIREIHEIIGRVRGSSVTQENSKTVMLSLYHEFWSIKLKERAVVMEALLISPDKMVSENEQLKAYQNALLYVLEKLFPNAAMDADEHFAAAFIQSYLDTADPYVRSYLLAGLLVASNESQTMGKVGAGKKLALFCESLGPAYVKLAQAIHSHPLTPENIKADLHHVKGRASPPYRWDLWLLIDNVLPEGERSKIKHIGKLLGSASYNLAVEVELVDGSHCVLLLLRENAEKDASNGFAHLKKTMSFCKHERMQAIRETGLSILEEAEKLSQIEMSHELSKQQAEIASAIYQSQSNINIGEQRYALNMVPSTIISSGQGYRFLTRMYGPEFNDLPIDTLFNRNIKKKIAKEMLTVELINILSGSYFDSDRHGNQMRVDIDSPKAQITLGLYDFGEMALEKPKETEIAQMIKVISEIPNRLIQLKAFDKAMDEAISKIIEEERQNNASVTYLTRVRKAVLALQDFQRELSNDDLFDVLKRVSESDQIVLNISDQLRKSVQQIEAIKNRSVTDTLFSFFNWGRNDIGMEQSTNQTSWLIDFW